MNKQALAFGSWPSPISGEQLTQGAVRLSEPQINDAGSFWLCSRPEDKGRTTIIFQATGADPSQQREIIPAEFNVRTGIHEYGGGSYLADGEQVFFVNHKDQRVYQYRFLDKGAKPIALSPEGNYRYADFCVDIERNQLICVCEIHRDDKEPKNCIIALKLDGSSTAGFNMLVFGNDFYSNPRVSPNGQTLSWLTWNHPYMPWDNTECMIASFTKLGLLEKHYKVAGGYISKDAQRLESIFQPQWSPTGELYFVSDRTGWWNIYRYNTNTKLCQLVFESNTEFGMPQWVFGMSCYGFLNSFTLFCCYNEAGIWRAGLIDTISKNMVPVALPFTAIEAIHCNDQADTAVMIAANAEQADCVILWHEHSHQVLAQSKSQDLSTGMIAMPEAISYHNSQNQAVHGFFYPPTHSDTQGLKDTLPPLIVICHGGPTAATKPIYNLKVQYWTSRGFAVFDINYSGSTGYGRPYRDRLTGQWGIADVDDICKGAEHLIDQGRVNPEQTIIRGSSAGGYSVLAALTFKDTFKAGASLYGIGDLSLLASDTHKFESRYLDQLIGKYPEDKATYEARSPLLHAEHLNCPVIFLQGLEDKVVPPNQAETMVAALAKNKVPVAHVTYPNEGHGFRQAETIKHSLAVEYAFYAKVFGFEPTENLPEVPFIEAEQ